MNLQALISTFGALVGVIVALAVLLPFVKGAARKSALELVTRERDIERDARMASEARCKEQISELRGQLQILTRDFGRTIAEEVIVVMKARGAIP